jgi:hypothetical protein
MWQTLAGELDGGQPYRIGEISMTFDEIKNLKVDDTVNYLPDPVGKPGKVVLGKVTMHGPRVDPAGNAITWMNDLLVVEIAGGPATVSWEPMSWPDGIPNLVASK